MLKRGDVMKVTVTRDDGRDPVVFPVGDGAMALVWMPLLCLLMTVVYTIALVGWVTVLMPVAIVIQLAAMTWRGLARLVG
jgi:hypothetical protein